MLSKRPFQRYALPLVKAIQPKQARHAVVKFPDAASVDLGALCFLKRGSRNRGRAGTCRLVDQSSLSKSRLVNIAALINYISNFLDSGSHRTKTVLRQVTGWILFIDWCDENSFSDIFSSRDQVRAACRSYLDWLKHRLRANEITIDTARHYQQEMLVFARDFLEVEDIYTGLRLIHSQKRIGNHTEPPDEKVQSRYLALCQSLFDGLSDLVLEEQPFPFRLAVPKYLRYKQPHLWVFPNNPWIMPPYKIAVRDQLPLAAWPIDYENGRIHEPADIAVHYGSIYEARKASIASKRVVAQANGDARCRSRLMAAVRAHNAFVMLFLANTGMNWQQLSELRWNRHYETEKSGAGFRTIKFRASNKTVFFKIRSRFLPRFRRFLELREFILADSGIDKHLFVRCDLRFAPTAKPLESNVVYHFNNLLKTIDPSLTEVTPRQLRAAKSDWSVRNTDISTTAMLLQNSEETTMKAYMAGSEAQANEELTLFFEELERKVTDTDSRSRCSTESCQVGHCRQYGDPKAAGIPSVPPDCQQAEGCLFCDRFVVHADEQDVRKLFSLEHCIARTAHLSGSAEHHDSIFAPVVQRIAGFTKYISNMSSDHDAMVTRVRKEVFRDGELDPYWARKLEMLIYLGLVSA